MGKLIPAHRDKTQHVQSSFYLVTLNSQNSTGRTYRIIGAVLTEARDANINNLSTLGFHFINMRPGEYALYQLNLVMVYAISPVSFTVICLGGVRASLGFTISKDVKLVAGHKYRNNTMKTCQLTTS